MENFGDVPVEGRVTRSLRKRLTSIDSENSQSRPGTPVGTKLDPIIELNSPSRSVRRTRRNSGTNVTPAKTPAKTSKTAQNRAVLSLDVSSEGSPMRRTTRRHSTSISIIEEEKSPLKSVISQFDALPEENSSYQSNSMGRRVTRATSKSPLHPTKVEKASGNTNTGKKSSKTESQFRTRKSSEESANGEYSDVEILDLEEIENQKKANKANADKSTQSEKKTEPEGEAREKKASNDKKLETREKDSSFKKYLMSNVTEEEDGLRKEKDNTTKKQTSPELNIKEVYLDSDVDHLFDENNLLIDLDDEGCEYETYTRDGRDSPADLEDELDKNETTSNKRHSAPIITHDIKLQRITPERIAKYTNIQGSKENSPKPSGNSPLRGDLKDITEMIKCVNFKESSDNDSVKISYPTTPFVVKSKSYIERNLLREAYKNASAKTLENTEIAEPIEEATEFIDVAKSLVDDSAVEEEFVEVLKTPNKTISSTIQSSTPLLLNEKEMTLNDEQKEIKTQIEHKAKSSEKLPKTDITQAEASKRTEEGNGEENSKRISLLETKTQESNISLDKLNTKQRDEILVADERSKKTPKTIDLSANKSLKNLIKEQLDENFIADELLEDTPKMNDRSANKSLKNLNKEQLDKNLVADERKLEEVPKTNHRPPNKSFENVNEAQLDESLVDDGQVEGIPKKSQCSANKSLKNVNKNQLDEDLVTGERKLEEVPEINKSFKNLNEKQLDENLVVDDQLEENNSGNKNTPKEGKTFASSWTQVSVKAGGRIDEISVEQPQRITTPLSPINDAVENNKSTEKIDSHKSPTFEPDDNESDREEDEDNTDEESESEDNGIKDDEPVEELTEHEKPYKKSSLIFDEAMEADDDYQSGDSMDSEELREMRDNEVPVGYESIGSGDTTEDEIEEGDYDEDDNSFIVQDSEAEREEKSRLEYSDDDEHLLEDERINKKKGNGKDYKHIFRIESSDSEHKEEESSSPEKVNQSLASESKKKEENEEDSMDSTTSTEKTLNTTRKSDFIVTIVDSTEDCKGKKNLSNKSKISIESDDDEYESAEMLPLLINDDDDGEPNADSNLKLNPGKNLNSSKLSESALTLQAHTSEENITDHEDEDNQYDKLNLSQKYLIKKLHPSERLNKTIHELRGEGNEQEDSSSSEFENFPAVTRRAASLGGKNEQIKILRKSLRQKRSKKLSAAVPSNTFSSEEEDLQTTENENVTSSKLRPSFGKSTSKQLESSNEYDIRENENSDETRESRNRKVRDEFNEHSDEDNNDADEIDYNIKYKKSKHGLSASFGQTRDLNKPSRAHAGAAHSSFTVGVSGKEEIGDITTPEQLNTSQSSLEDDNQDQNADEESSTTSHTKAAEFSSAEDEPLFGKLPNDDFQSLKINRRHSFINPEVAAAKQTIPTPERKASKINSKKRNTFDVNINAGDFNPSRSLVENIEERKQELIEKNTAKRKRFSKSFCEDGGGGTLGTTEDEEVRHLHKKVKQLPAKEKNTQNDNSRKNTIQQILGRCDEILEAANRAKLESKQNFNQSKVKLRKPKKVKNMVVESIKENDENEEEDAILKLKEIKRKEQAKAEIEKALKASASIILRKPQNTKTKPVVSQDMSVAARAAISSDADSVTSKPKKSKALQGISSILPAANDEKHLQRAPHKLKSSAGEVLEIPITEKKKKKLHHDIKLPTGLVRVEPLTPKKKRLQGGFRESPATPRSLGFKVRHILTAGQDTPPEIPTVLGKRKRRKIEEPKYTLPKPQWTQSGVFMEEDLCPSITVANTRSTQFMVSTLNDGRKKKKCSVAAPAGKSSSSGSALQFKKNAFFQNNIPRESSHELLLRKQRQYFQSHY